MLPSVPLSASSDIRARTLPDEPATAQLASKLDVNNRLIAKIFSTPVAHPLGIELSGYSGADVHPQIVKLLFGHGFPHSSRYECTIIYNIRRGLDTALPDIALC